MSDGVVIACAPFSPELAELEFNDPAPANCQECKKQIILSKDARKMAVEREAKLMCVSCVQKLEREDPEEFTLAGPIPGEFSQRLEELRKDVAANLGPGGVLVAAWIMCNGCGKRAQVFSDEDLEGWHLGGHRAGTDLCPDCQREFLRWAE